MLLKGRFLTRLNGWIGYTGRLSPDFKTRSQEGQAQIPHPGNKSNRKAADALLLFCFINQDEYLVG
jgi:hypothetical protein